jgi:hypothetical protein
LCLFSRVVPAGCDALGSSKKPARSRTAILGQFVCARSIHAGERGIWRAVLIPGHHRCWRAVSINESTASWGQSVPCMDGIRTSTLDGAGRWTQGRGRAQSEAGMNGRAGKGPIRRGQVARGCCEEPLEGRCSVGQEVESGFTIACADRGGCDKRGGRRKEMGDGDDGVEWERRPPLNERMTLTGRLTTGREGQAQLGTGQKGVPYGYCMRRPTLLSRILLLLLLLLLLLVSRFHPDGFVQREAGAGERGP